MLDPATMKKLEERYTKRLRCPVKGSDDLHLYLYREGSYMSPAVGVGPHFAHGYVQVVIGRRGPYVEFVREHLCDENGKSLKLKLVEERPTHFRYEFEGVRIYWQKERVNYASYREGFLYVDPMHLQLVDGTRLLSPKRDQLKLLG